MCSLCGVLAGRGHWTDSASNPATFESRSETHTRRRERQDRTRIANRILDHYGLSLSDWQGAAYVLKSRTGQTMLVDNLSELWTAAEAITGKVCDPLDDGLLAALRDPGRF